MAGPFLPDECLHHSLHGIELIPKNSDPKQSESLATLKVWPEKNQPGSAGAGMWNRQDIGERYQSLMSLHPTKRGLLLKVDCEGKGSFHYTPDGVGIYWESGGTGPEHYFQTLGLGVWLEQNGIACIHANALALGDSAIGLIAPSRTGKTTLTAALIEHGLKAMTDDMLALHRKHGQWQVFPSWPQLRMWPDSAAKFIGQDPKLLAKVHHRFEKRLVDIEEKGSDAFCAQAMPLRHLYVLERRANNTGEVVITDLAPAHAVTHLLQNSILSDAYGVLELEAKRLGKLAMLVEQVPLKKISYPGGMENLPGVCEHIIRDCQ